MAKKSQVSFTVDVHLLAELGERLVGKPAIALGELIKNAYDADASTVSIRFRHDSITVIDNGHGMSMDQLLAGFLRVGTAIKERQRFSPSQRRMTGSKGVGRLAAQMLGRSLILETRSDNEGAELLKLTFDWDDKTEGADLAEFKAVLERAADPVLLGASHGTAVKIGNLARRWTTKDIETLARDIWMLRSPFETGADDQQKFAIEFEAEQESFEEAFDRVVAGWFDLYEARLTGELHGPHSAKRGHAPDLAHETHVHLALRFSEDEGVAKAAFPTGDALGHAEFEIRIYKLQGRQPLGLSVKDVRDYLNENGGVYLYDEGFRLPYYGPDTDWLGVEIDHSHRRTVSAVLPKELQVPGGGTFLPTMSRLFGAVRVSTGAERDRVSSGAVAETDSLQIQVSRDRLLDTEAFDTLTKAVRAGLDLYAHEKARRKYRAAEAKLAETQQRLETTADPLEILDAVQHELTQDTYDLLVAAMAAEREAMSARLELQEHRAATMGALATAGMVALLVEHEQARLLPRMKAFVDKSETSDDASIRSLAAEISEFVDSVESLRPLLRSTMEPENRMQRPRLSARSMARRTQQTLAALLRGVTVEIVVSPSLRLPPGSVAEWTALLQNVLLNAANAVISTTEPRIKILGRGAGRSLQVLDNGHGIELARAESYFEPFTRGDEQLPPERRALGMGGTGLGLTIVRTIAEALGASAQFEKPPGGWSTAFVLRW